MGTMEKVEAKLTTLCYIEKNDSYLMLHRNKKKKDLSADMWIGVGGHFEKWESPSECLLREVKEETGLTLTSYKLRGIVTFLYSEETEAEGTGNRRDIQNPRDIGDVSEFEYMFLYTADAFTGSIRECDEGELEFIRKDKLKTLYFWTGDEIFLKLIENDYPFFDLKLTYKGKTLRRAILDGKELELFDILDENYEPTGIVRERSIVHERGDWHRTVHIWVVRVAEGKMEVLLQKRAANKDSFPGCYDISSAGHIQAGDDYETSALRELFEELGIKAAAEELELVGTHKTECHSRFYGKPFINREYSNVYIYDATGKNLQWKLQKEEVETVMWIEYEAGTKELEEGTLENCILMDEWSMIGEWLKQHKQYREQTNAMYIQEV